MGAWGNDLWADEAVLDFVADILRELGLLGKDESLGYAVLMVSNKSGSFRLVMRRTFDELLQILIAMDQELTAEQMESLEPRIDELAKDEIFGTPLVSGGPVTQKALWAILCMHVGAKMPSAARDAALEAFGPGGKWANNRSRVRIANVMYKELLSYRNDGRSGKVRFPAETPWSVVEIAGTRYGGWSSRDQPVHERKPERADIKIWVQHQCANCKTLEQFDEQKDCYAKFPKCLGCEQVRYCGSECQAQDWPKHKEICGAKKRSKKGSK